MRNQENEDLLPHLHLEIKDGYINAVEDFGLFERGTIPYQGAADLAEAIENVVAPIGEKRSKDII